MRDTSLINSTVIALGATKDTPVAGGDTFEFGTIDSRFRLSEHRTGNQEALFAVFSNLGAAMASGDQFLGMLYDCDTVGGTYVEIGRTAYSAAACAAGTRQVMQVPLKHRKFLKFYAMGTSSGTLTTKDITCWIEPGANL